MIVLLLWVILSLVILWLGSEMLISGSIKIAYSFNVSPLIIGLTIVSLGTSAPELAVGIASTRDGEGGLMLGNIAGTNILNILFILGLSALIRPIKFKLQILLLELPVIIFSSVLLIYFSMDQFLSRNEGAVLILGAFIYSVALFFWIKKEKNETDIKETKTKKKQKKSVLLNAFLLFLGLIIVIVGADLLVKSASDLARALGLKESIIGLTIVAIGTSAPELVTTIVSTLKNEREVAIGNLLGSSIYNILMILGITCIINPVRFGSDLLRVDLPLMLIVALICVPVFITKRTISRIEGGIFVGLYFSYMSWLIFMRI